jgi:hypothetical protein
MNDRHGVRYPDGTVIDCTDIAHRFDQTPEDHAREIAANTGGAPVRITPGRNPE